MGRPIDPKSIEARLNPLREEMTAERFAKLVADVLHIEDNCQQMALFPAAPMGATQESARYHKIRVDIARRLRGICSHCTEIEFLLLVDTMAHAQLRGESQRARLMSSIDRGIRQV